jgi:tetratricopeptide (TPR) repeat protein
MYRLARIHFHKGQLREALAVLDRISGSMPAELSEEVGFLRANVLMALGRAPEAAGILEELQGSDVLHGFSTYNLGIAQLEAGDHVAAIRSLDRAGRIRAGDRSSHAIRDKSNLVLGTLLFEAGEYQRARSSLDRIRLDGPYSNHALLRAGWTDATEERFDRALVPWSILAKRDPTDEAVQEAFLALPFAYSKLEVHGRAAVLYERAASSFAGELAKLDASVASIESGHFLRALEGQEIRQDKDWVVRMRGLPDAPETFYLISLMSSHEFQTALQNYIDLMDMRRSLLESQRSLDAFQDLVRHRRGYYTPRLPETDRAFRRLDAQMRLRLEQRDNLDDRLQKMLTSPAPRMLATAEEQALSLQIDELRDRLEGVGEGDSAERLRARLDRVEGVLTWRLETHYHERLTEVHDRLRELSGHVEALRRRYDSFVRVRQAAEHSHVGYDPQIEDLRRRGAEAIARIDRVKQQQGRMLESVAIRELGLRRGRLVGYQDKARFAFADSYDRAVKAQAR